METIYQTIGDTNDSFNQSYKGGFIIGGGESIFISNCSFDETNGRNETKESKGGSNRFQNKVVPFGLAMKRTKPYVGHECKNGDILDKDLFDKLFNLVSKVEKREKNKNNKTKRIKK